MQRMNLLNTAFLNGDQEFILSFCIAEFGIEPTPSDLKAMTKQGFEYASSKSKSKWSDESFRSWIKNRIEKYFHRGFCQGVYAVNDKLCSARLHVFFPHLIEDEMMLYRLRRPEPATEPEVPASKIFNDDSRIPTPINRTAKLVGGKLK